jgi:predicted Fe-Mo cluster-binding NifX family protein
MLIAVTTSDGKQVDTHFGKADRFLVYEVGNGEPQLLREVQAPAYCGWAAELQTMSPDEFDMTLAKMRECADAPPSHHMMPDKLAAIAQALGDCRVVVTAMIGDAPREELERLGISVHAVNAPVSEVLNEVVKLY